MKTESLYTFIEAPLPTYWDPALPALPCYGVVIYGGKQWEGLSNDLFSASRVNIDDFTKGSCLVRSFRPGVSHPMAQSLAAALQIPDSQIRVDWLVLTKSDAIPSDLFKKLEWAWREPAIEDLEITSFEAWKKKNQSAPELVARVDDSFSYPSPSEIGLEFNFEETAALKAEEERRGRKFNRCELELFAQTWSEHCKHKIFGARIEESLAEPSSEMPKITEGLFKTYIQKPTQEILKKNPSRCLSVFHDNAGVLSLWDEKGGSTDWALCLKMETHNSPSAISPYGGASTGVVGVHRDILGTGVGAMPIANWDVLCFESPAHAEARPSTALPPDVIRSGIIKGIEDGGNQSGIPTVQGSVYFDPAYAVKPLVFAGAAGLMPKSCVQKHPKVGLKLYCFGGAVGADGLRGAVMSSRDLRSQDFLGSAVQVANAFVQRRMTDFLMEARDKGLIDVTTDNGAGGLASSVGEMATLTGGALIDVSPLRLKFKGLHAWERLLSESQERMTVATSKPEALEALAQSWEIPFDRLGELNDSGELRVLFEGQALVDLSLKFLHEGCPRLNLKTAWTSQKEEKKLSELRNLLPQRSPDVMKDFPQMLESIHLCSREGVVRRFDHEVQGRTLRKPFAGEFQTSPQDGSTLEIYENGENPASFVLSHGLAPQRKSIFENVLFSFDEALRSALIAGAKLETAGLLDNFCWADPIPAPNNPHADRRLWRLVRSCETLATLCREFSLPLISGKDSMKNNSRDFEIPETLVISLGASAGPREKTPTGFFARANDVVFVLPLLQPTLRDSAWERIFASQRESNEESLDLMTLISTLKSRYERLEKAVAQGLLRSAKDISEGGLLMSVFEMTLGRKLGFHFEEREASKELLSEGLGGLVLGVDPHNAKELEKTLPEAKRLGVVGKPFELRWAGGTTFDLSHLEKAYLKKSQEGFWR